MDEKISENSRNQSNFNQSRNPITNPYSYSQASSQSNNSQSFNHIPLNTNINSISEITMKENNFIDIPTPELLYKPSNVFASFMQDFCILMTFGICSPILSISITISSILTVLHYRIILGRFLYIRQSSLSQSSLIESSYQNNNRYNANNINSNDAAIIALENSLIGIPNLMILMVWPIVIISCLFISFLCWDISGDKIGWEKSIWAPSLALTILAVLWFFSSRFTVSWNLLEFISKHFDIELSSPENSKISSDAQQISDVQREYESSNRSSITSTLLSESKRPTIELSRPSYSLDFNQISS